MKEGPGQERMWGQDPSPNWCREEGREVRAQGRCVRLTSHKPYISRCLSPGCLSPFLLARAGPAGRWEGAAPPRAGAGRLARSTLLSLNSRQSSRRPLSDANAFRCRCSCQHTSNLLAAGASPVLVLDPVRSVSFLFHLGYNTPARTPLTFSLALGCSPGERAPGPPGPSPITAFPPRLSWAARQGCPTCRCNSG